MLIKGKDLTSRQAEMVKSAYVHRLTHENNYPAHNPCNATVKPITDEQWIKDHAFHFIKDGSRLMANRNHCEPVYMAD